MHNVLHQSEFDFHENKPVRGTHFHINGFAQKDSLSHEAKYNSEMAYSKCSAGTMKAGNAAHFWSVY